MRILQIPTEVTIAPPSRQAAPAESTAATGALERLVDALREKIRKLEERLSILEAAPQMAAVPQAAPSSVPTPTRPTIAPVSIDPEAFKKNLLNKMWKYLQDDERPAKTV